MSRSDAFAKLDNHPVGALSLFSQPLNHIRCSRYEVFRHEKVRTGFFSDVYRGGRTVAIKLLAKTTPRDLFLSEVGIWAALRHPHVLWLFGVSSASGDPPWFMVMSLERNGSLVQYLKGFQMVWGVGGAGAGEDLIVGLGIGALPCGEDEDGVCAYLGRESETGRGRQ
jgi:hypothetical protein